MNKLRKRQTLSGRSGGFTLVELLVVISVIAVLVSILLVAMSKARRSARVAQTTRQLASITTAMDAFKTDFDWYPPLMINNDEGGNPTTLLDNGEPMYVVPEAVYFSGAGGSNVEEYRQAMAHARYHSTVSITAYLVGAGDLNGDEVETYDLAGTERIEPNFDDGADGPGIRNPGERDKSWGGGADRSLQVPFDSGDTYPDDGATRLRAQVIPPRGRVYGPYLDPGILGDRLARGNDGMYQVEDSFGYPIRYYRGFPTRSLATNDVDISVVPVELRSFDSYDLEQDVIGGGGTDFRGAMELDRGLLSADFVLLSGGAEGDDPVIDGERAAFPRRLGDPPANHRDKPDIEFVPPTGDLVRDSGGVLTLLQTGWGDPSDTGTLAADSDETSVERMVSYLKTNVRSVR